MGWFILILVVVFLIVSAMPLIREIKRERMRREVAAPELEHPDVPSGSALQDEDGRAH